MMSQKKQLSNVSKELGCTLIKLTTRTILLTEKNFQDCSNLLRQSKYPVLQNSSSGAPNVNFRKISVRKTI